MTSLQKKVKKSFLERIDDFIMSHASAVLAFLIVLLIVMICLLIVALAQAATPFAVVDSGNYYNHLQDVICICGGGV